MENKTNTNQEILDFIASKNTNGVYLPVPVEHIAKHFGLDIHPLSIRIIQLIDAGYLETAGGQKVIGNGSLLVKIK